MSVSSELKRRLFAEDEPFSKRLKLAENAFVCHWLPLTNKEEIIIQWVVKELENSSYDIFNFLDGKFVQKVDFKCIANDTKQNLIKGLRKSINKIPDEKFEIILDSCISLLENNSMFSCYQQYLAEYFMLIDDLLKLCDQKFALNLAEKKYIEAADKLFSHMLNLMKHSRKSTEFIVEFIRNGIFSTSLNLIRHEEISAGMRKKLISILFPNNSPPLYKAYILTLLKGTKISKLIEQKSENIKPAITIINMFLESSINRFLLDNFIEMFVSRFKTDETLVFLFYILIIKYLNLTNDVEISGEIKPFSLDATETSDIYYKMLHMLKTHNVNVNIFLSTGVIKQNVTGENKISFTSLIYETAINIINNENILLENRLKITHEIVKLEPLIIEPNIENILTDFFTNNCSHELLSATSIIMLEIKFKIGRSVEFVTSFLKMFQTKTNKIDIEEVKKFKLPSEFCIKFGQLTSEMIPQHNVKMFEVLNEHLSELSTSNTLTLSHLVVFQLLGSFFEYSKMANENIVTSTITDFIKLFDLFAEETLSKCLTNFTPTENSSEIILDMIYHYGSLKSLLLRYQAKYENNLNKNELSSSIFKYDISFLHSYLSSDSWKKFFKVVSKNNNEKCLKARDLLIIQNWCTHSSHFSEKIDISNIFPKLSNCFDNKYSVNVIFSLDDSDLKAFANFIFKNSEENYSYELEEYFINNYPDKSKSILQAFCNEHVNYFCEKTGEIDNMEVAVKLSKENINKMNSIFKLWSKIPIENFDEDTQLSILLTVIKVKSIKKLPSCDEVILKIFELCNKTPDLLSKVPFQFLCNAENPIFNLNNSEYELSYLVTNKIFAYLIEREDNDALKVIFKNIKKEITNDISNYNLQLTSILFISLSNVRSKLFDKSSDVMKNALENSDWKNDKIDENSIIKSSLNGFENSETEEFYTSSWNLIKSFSLLLSDYLKNKSENDNVPLFITKTLPLFTNSALLAISMKNNCILHTKEALQLINTVLNNWTNLKSLFESEDDFLKLVWLSHLIFFKNSSSVLQNRFPGITEMISENVKLTLELSSPQMFQKYIAKHLTAIINFETVSLANDENSLELTMKSISKVWLPFLHANLKDKQKTDFRNNLIKKLSINLHMWLKKNDVMSQEYNYTSTYFDMIIQMLGIKKVAISRHIIDHTIQLPSLISFDVQKLDKEKVLLLCLCYEKSLNLLMTLISQHSEMIQDRWPCYLQSYRSILSAIFAIINCEAASQCDEDKFVFLAHKFEKLTSIMVKNQKQDLARIAAYVVADIINNFQNIQTAASVKFHIQNCVYFLLQLLDNYAIGFLMRNFSDTCTMIFQRIYDNYLKFYKYTGKY